MTSPADRAKLNQSAAKGQGVVEHLESLGGGKGKEAANALLRERLALFNAAHNHDPAATADAARQIPTR